jgi:serine/threonine protein kinase
MSHQDDLFDAQNTTRLMAGGMPAAAEFASGDIVGGTYQVISFIGAGGMGNVYRVRHTIMDAEYALKTLSAEKVTERAWRRFQNEAQAIARINHPNIVAIYNLGLHEDRLPYYVMDLLQGTPLSDILKQKGRLETDETLLMFIEVCAGLGYAHKKGIVHRDIKPANIVVTDKPDPTGARIKIVDFGIAKLTHTKDLANQQLTNAGEICGSPYYMSPEQCDAGTIDARSDIYSLGCTLFEALTGRPPFKGRNAVETMLLHHSGTPPNLKDSSGGIEFPQMLEMAVETMLAKAPMDRYQNMERVARDLTAVLQGAETPANPYQGQQKKQAQRENTDSAANDENDPAKEQTPHFNILALGTALVAAVLLVAAGSWWLSIQTKSASTNDSNAPSISTARGASSAALKVTSPANLAPFSSVITREDGQKCILFKFPPEELLGAIQIDNDKDQIKCRGDVTIPYGHKLTFIASTICLVHPEYLHRLRPDDFESLAIQPVMESGVLTDTSLEHITHLTGLTTLTIDFCGQLDDGALPYIEKLPKLQTLNIDGTNITPARLATSPLLRRLNGLTIQTEKNITPLLKSLKGSTTLEHLCIKETQLQHSDYQLIAAIKNLKTLETPKCETTNQDLATISTLDKLTHINIQDSHINLDAVPILKRMHAQGLKSIHLMSKYIKADDYEGLHQAGTGLSFP